MWFDKVSIKDTSKGAHKLACMQESEIWNIKQNHPINKYLNQRNWRKYTIRKYTPQGNHTHIFGNRKLKFFLNEYYKIEKTGI